MNKLSVVLCMLTLVCSRMPVFADALVLGESDVIQLGLKNPAWTARVAAAQREARADVHAAGHWDNPSVEYSRESLDLPQGRSEERSVWLRQRLDIAGQKSLEKRAAAFGLQARQWEAVSAERAWKTRLRELFYQTLATGQKKAALAQQQARLHSVAVTVRQRADKGDASRFDVMRVENEEALLLSEQAKCAAEHAVSQRQLFALVGREASPLRGDLLPHEVLPGDFDSNGHPDVQMLQADRQGQQQRAKAAGREFWPRLTLALGRKELLEGDVVADGNSVAIGLEIPLFDRGQGHRQAAQSRVDELAADVILLERQLQADYHAALDAYDAHRRAAVSLRNLISNEQRSLSTLAEASYHAGELPVTALVDAYQAQRETHEHFIDTAHAARRAYIQLQHLRGE